jgi:hypothetical protein
MSPPLGTSTSTATTQDETSGDMAEEQVHQPPGILNSQSSMVKQCYDWIEKFKSGIMKKSKVIFEIHSILSTSGEKSDAIKATAQLYTRIINQHDLKVARALKRGRMEPGQEGTPILPKSSCDSS